MPDPRGHGFNKSRGKWHAPVRRLALPTLIDFGWKFHGFIEPYPTAYYTQGNYKLTQHDLGRKTKTVATHTRTGRVWEFWTTDPAEITAAIFGDSQPTTQERPK